MAPGQPAATHKEQKGLLNMRNKEFGNPRGAGQYGYIRSSEDRQALTMDEMMSYDPTSKRWFEDYGKGYNCERDGVLIQEWDAMMLDSIYKSRPKVSFREAFYDIQYGFTRNQIANVTIILKEKQGDMHRTFDFEVKQITMKAFKEYVDALVEWHRTGELNIGPYKGEPDYGCWYRN